jgi:hypothetical protein
MMAEAFREKERLVSSERTLPLIQKEQNLHSPLDSLGRSAVHLRTPAESTRIGGPKAISKTDLDMRITRNVSSLRLEGSTPLHERLIKLLESMQG